MRVQGAAVKAGMLAARGEALLMMDADGATQVRDLERLEAALAGAAKNGVARPQMSTDVVMWATPSADKVR